MEKLLFVETLHAYCDILFCSCFAFASMLRQYARKENKGNATVAVTIMSLALISFGIFLPKLFTTQTVELDKNDTFSNTSKSKEYEIVGRKAYLNMAANLIVVPLFFAFFLVNIILICNIERKTKTSGRLNQSIFTGPKVLRRRKNLRSQTMNLVIWLTTNSAAGLILNVSGCFFSYFQKRFIFTKSFFPPKSINFF
jgi:hypothetical protein